MAEFSNYPNQIDITTELPKATDNVTPVKAELFNRLRDAIVSVENELGIQPSSTYSTVKDRLDAMDAKINQGGGGGSGGVSKEYVDLALQSSEFKTPVYVTTGLSPFPVPYTVVNNVLSLTQNGFIGQDITGVDILLAGETGPQAPFNGIYVVTDSGSPTTPFTMVRRDDADTSEKVSFGMCVFSKQFFDKNVPSVYMLVTPNPIELNVTPLTFVAVVGPESSSIGNDIEAGNGLISSVNGNTKTLSVQNADGSINVGSGGIKVGTITDTQHGFRGGGTLHNIAIAGNPGTAGFIDGLRYQLLIQAGFDPIGGTLFKRDGSGGGSLQYLNLSPDTSQSDGAYIRSVVGGGLDTVIKSGVHATLGPQFVNGGGTVPNYQYFITDFGFAQTVGFTKTLLWQYILPNDSIAVITATITADSITDGYRGGFVRKATVRNVIGVGYAEILGSVDTIGTDGTDPGLAATVSIEVSPGTGSYLNVFVTGTDPSQTIKWFGTIHMTYQAR